MEERVKAYGWHCDGSDIIGHYVTTENYRLTYNMQGVFTKMVPLRELSQSVARQYSGVLYYSYIKNLK